MPLTLYGLKTCDTCKKARKALEAAGKPARFVDIRAETDLTAKVPVWLGAVGPDRLINRSSTTWRNLSEGEKTADPLSLLTAHPTLIKRPVIETGSAIHVGWKQDVQDALL